MLPRPETARDAKNDAAKGFMYQADRAFQDGVWQTDGSRHTIGMDIDKDELSKGTMLVAPKPGKPTLRVAYFFSGVTRKASIADELRKLCEIDVLVGGSEHDLLDKNSQDLWISSLEDGDFDVIILSPPCGTWSRANWANNDGPKPCRNRQHPWGDSMAEGDGAEESGDRQRVDPLFD